MNSNPQSADQSLPAAFVESLSMLGEERATVVRDALLTEPSVSVRRNRGKLAPTDGSLPFESAVPWCAEGSYLSSRPAFTLDPALHQGRYYVQDASSMFLDHVVRSLIGDRDVPPLLALDACAAPGGKTTVLIDALPSGSVVVANEFVPKRAAVLKENVIKWGYPSVVVTRDDTARIPRACDDFDIIVADVPCSGEGMMRKDKTAVSQWSPALISECVTRQREIVGNLWDALAPGGYLIYSTCTFNREENELMVESMVHDFGADSIAVPVEQAWGITPGIDTACHCYRFLPGLTRGEGLFMAVLRKPGVATMGAALSSMGYSRKPSAKKSCGKSSSQAKTKAVLSSVSSWLADAERYEVGVSDGRVNAVPKLMAPLADRLMERLNVIHHGICLGEIKGDSVVPAQSLAMSQSLAGDAFPMSDLQRQDALKYLRREALSLPEGTPKGLVLVSYESSPLGFVKNLGSRANNLYPAEWRILSSRDE